MYGADFSTHLPFYPYFLELEIPRTRFSEVRGWAGEPAAPALARWLDPASP